ncbi:MAG: hypothetical protein K0S63_1437 [Gammaproteobacteria bacterium]|jgi:hypothetical protein|nr:hypothetical protein [Gammaproteobacteria bacterium]
MYANCTNNCVSRFGRCRCPSDWGQPLLVPSADSNSNNCADDSDESAGDFAIVDGLQNVYFGDRRPSLAPDEIKIDIPPPVPPRYKQASLERLLAARNRKQRSDFPKGLAWLKSDFQELFNIVAQDYSLDIAYGDPVLQAHGDQLEIIFALLDRMPRAILEGIYSKFSPENLIDYGSPIFSKSAFLKAQLASYEPMSSGRCKELYEKFNSKFRENTKRIRSSMRTKCYLPSLRINFRKNQYHDVRDFMSAEINEMLVKTIKTGENLYQVLDEIRFEFSNMCWRNPRRSSFFTFALIILAFILIASFEATQNILTDNTDLYFWRRVGFFSGVTFFLIIACICCLGSCCGDQYFQISEELQILAREMFFKEIVKRKLAPHLPQPLEEE